LFSLPYLVRLLLLSFFFFQIIRHPPTSPLFPTRRSPDLEEAQLEYDWIAPAGERDAVLHLEIGGADIKGGYYGVRNGRHFYHDRSEEHTSELQSLTKLVCRLLLEKKKIIK